jgi:hypothetical protein
VYEAFGLPAYEAFRRGLKKGNAQTYSTIGTECGTESAHFICVDSEPLFETLSSISVNTALLSCAVMAAVVKSHNVCFFKFVTGNEASSM